MARQRRVEPDAICSIEGCDESERCMRLCSFHYVRSRADIPADLPRLIRERGTGSHNRDGYLQVKIRGKRYFLHRVAMEEILGRPLLPNETVHHRNGIRDDNRPENLELWVHQQPRGQRASDLVDFIVEMYPEQVLAKLLETWQKDPARRIRRGIRG